MNCEELRELLSDHTALLEIESNDEAMRHIASCETCRAWLTYEKQLTSAFEQICNRQPPVALADRVIAIPAEERRRTADRAPWWAVWRHRSWWPAALAGGVVGVFLALSLNWFISPSPLSSPSASSLQLQSKSRTQAQASSPLLFESQTMTAAATQPESSMVLAKRENDFDKAAPSLSGDQSFKSLAAGKITPKESESSIKEDGSFSGDGMRDVLKKRTDSTEIPDRALRREKTEKIIVADASADEISNSARADNATVVFQIAQTDDSPSGHDRRAILNPSAIPSGIPRPTTSFQVTSNQKTTFTESGRLQQQVALESAKIPPSPPSIPDAADAFEADKIPIVRGEPLDDEAFAPTPRPMALSKKMSAPSSPPRVQLKPAAPKEPLAPKIHVKTPVAPREIISSREIPESKYRSTELERYSTERAKTSSIKVSRSDSLPSSGADTGDERSSFVSKAKNEARDASYNRGVSLPRDDRHAKIEAVLRSHIEEIKEGPLDINLWVVNGWISVKERIFLAPPPGYHWVAIRRGASWEASLQKISGR